MPIENHIGGAHRSGGDNFIPETLHFVSTCPRCLKERHQRGYTRAALGGLLLSGYKIEGYCVTCDAFWSITGPERAALAQRLQGLKAPTSRTRAAGPRRF
jgi:hypothetical protein